MAPGNTPNTEIAASFFTIGSPSLVMAENRPFVYPIFDLLNRNNFKKLKSLENLLQNPAVRTAFPTLIRQIQCTGETLERIKFIGTWGSIEEVIFLETKLLSSVTIDNDRQTCNRLGIAMVAWWSRQEVADGKATTWQPGRGQAASSVCTTNHHRRHGYFFNVKICKHCYTLNQTTSKIRQDGSNREHVQWTTS